MGGIDGGRRRGLIGGRGCGSFGDAGEVRVVFLGLVAGLLLGRLDRVGSSLPDVDQRQRRRLGSGRRDGCCLIYRRY